MELGIKNLKINKVMSQETTCFSATVYADGKKAGVVMNQGTGGSNRYQWDDYDLGQQILAWAKNQPTEYKFDKLDQLIDKLMQRAEVEKQMNKWCKKETLFKLKGDGKGWRQVKALYSPEVKAFLLKKYGGELAMIANEDIEQAIQSALTE